MLYSYGDLQTVLKFHKARYTVNGRFYFQYV